MKFFKFFALGCLFFFLIACDEGAKRFIPVDETGDGSSELADDSDPADPENPTDDPTNPTDDPTNPTDDPTNPTDDPTNPTDDPTNPTDDPTNPTDDPTNPTDDPTNPTDDPTDPTVEPDSDEAKCIAAGGTWDAFAEEDFERCYKIVNCELPEGENAEYIVWRSDQSYTEYYDVDDGQWTHFGVNYATEYSNTGEPKICQYICALNALREDDKCKPVCSATFNGSSSRVVVQHNALLNLEHFWTIEAWVKQDLSNLSTSALPIVRKGGLLDSSYYLTAVYEEKKALSLSDKYKKLYGGFYSNGNIIDEEFSAESGSDDEDDLENALNSGWNHIALSFYVKTQENKAYLRLYVNGRLIAEKTKQNTNIAPKSVDDELTIGYSAKKVYFKGKIDQLKITKNYYDSEFTPSKLSVDDNTIAFYDFSNNAEDSSVNALHGSGTNVTYSTDCAF